MDPPKTPGEMEWQVKQREYEAKKARAKALKLRLTCSICSEKAKLNCPCGTTQYCSTECQRIDWRDRGHRKACKKIRNERAAEAARAEAPPPPKEVVYGPAPRSHADEVRARIAAEHEAARARREAEPEPEMMSARFGSRCPICMEEWDVNATGLFRVCCCRLVCKSCEDKIGVEACPLCRVPYAESDAEELARLRRHVENEVPEAIACLGDMYSHGQLGLVKSDKKAAKIYRRAVQLGDVDAMLNLGKLYESGSGVKLDKKQAERLYRLAADRGNAIARHNLAVILDGEQNYEEAFRHFKRAAEQGYAPSKTNIGIYLFNGRPPGVERDRDEAMRWLESAAADGYGMAIDALARIDAHESSRHAAPK
jgi:tetratricopeptide (TPR) repeat protein